MINLHVQHCMIDIKNKKLIKKYILEEILPVKTNLADASATSNAVFPSVFRILGSAPCCKRTS